VQMLPQCKIRSWQSEELSPYKYHTTAFINQIFKEDNNICNKIFRQMMMIN